MLTFSLVLVHDNAGLYVAASAPALLEHFNWELFDRPPYSPDPTPSEYHLFIYMKNWLRSQRFAKHEELMEAVGARLSTHTQHTL
jgi:transposase